jgi:tRNA-dihydrouridine synthase C
VSPFVSIAPMEGVVDWILRDLLTSIGGIDRTVTEFIRVTDRILPEHVFLRYCPELLNGGKTAAGVPCYVQLLGGQPEWIAENAKIAESLGAPGIDLNFGCPAKTVNRHDGGAALLQKPSRLYDVISAVKAAVKIPVTAKTRLGFENKDYHLDIARACDDAGAASLTIHARTKKEGYIPPAHWEYIARMKGVVKLPILANGEIWSHEDYERCVAACGIRDVALGRGLVSRPDLAAQIKFGAKPLTWTDVLEKYFRPFFEKSFAFKGDHFACVRAKQLLKFMSRSYPEALELFLQIKTLKHATEMRVHFGAKPAYPEEGSWLNTFKSIPGPTARTASALKIY